MKALTVLVLLAGVVLGTIALRYSSPNADAAPSIPRALPATVPAGFVVHAFEVDGICCESCPESLVEALHGVEGVKAIAVDPDTHRVEIEVPAGVEPATLASALTFGDYVARPLTRP